MQSFDLGCSECGFVCESASSLLQHFAQHVNDSLLENIINKSPETKKGKVPDLYPITEFRNRIQNKSAALEEEHEDPLIFCQVTLKEEIADDKTVQTNEDFNVVSIVKKKFSCDYCDKSFAWSTDLKRHILKHTGERPFKCHVCTSSFTRKFLLQNHVSKMHVNKLNIPDLKPIFSAADKKSKRDWGSEGIVEGTCNNPKNYFQIESNFVCI